MNHTIMMDRTISPPRVDDDWPASGLETLERCPVCESTVRSILHQGLHDNVFFCAPGQWTMWSCGTCRSAYLDPRPTPETIHIAYERYYTHTVPAAVSPKFENLALRAKIRRALGNGYRNWRYGTRHPESNRIGVVLALALPWLRRSNDSEFRHLPHPGATKGRRLLDVGFGSGAFLDLAASAGWQAFGCDPDPIAVENARARGLDVRQGGLEAWADEEACFDAITMSHVIEHVHDPVATIRAIHRLLRPGGQFYIDTPNIDALGHQHYGRSWIGLDPPRHLVLFHWRSMRRLLMASGFHEFQRRAYPVMNFSAIASARIAAGFAVFGPDIGRVTGPGLRLRLRAQLAYGRSEFVTLICRKPK